ETGLRNQIRVHFAEAGHPLLGEKKYTHEEGGQGARRIFLHAAVLGFLHPATRAPMRFEAPLPPDLEAWQAVFRQGRTRAAPPPAPFGPRAPRAAEEASLRAVDRLFPAELGPLVVGDAVEGLHHARIELRAGVAGDLFASHREGPPASIWAIAHDRVHGV